MSLFKPSLFFFFDFSWKDSHFADFNRWLFQFWQIIEKWSWFKGIFNFWSSMTSKLNSLLKSNRNRIKMEINFINEINWDTSESRFENRIVSIWVDVLNSLTSNQFSWGLATLIRFSVCFRWHSCWRCWFSLNCLISYFIWYSCTLINIILIKISSKLPKLPGLIVILHASPGMAHTISRLSTVSIISAIALWMISVET